MQIAGKIKNKTIIILCTSVIAGILLLVAVVNNAAAVTVPWTPESITSVSTGGEHACALSVGKVYCWGKNSQGQIGNGSTSQQVPYLTPVDTSGVLKDKSIVSVSAGKYSTCAIDSNYELYCWGDNTFGQLGDGTNTSRTIPVKVGGVLEGKQVTQVALGNHSAKRSGYDNDTTCAVADSKVYCWGSNFTGGLGIGSYDDQNQPVAVSTSGVLSGKNVKQVAVSRTHACVVTDDGVAACWGSNTSGQLGNGTQNASPMPLLVTTSGVLAGKTVSHVSVGQERTCVIASDKAYCWGGNSGGQLGDGTTNDSSLPVAVFTSGWLGGKTITEMSAGPDHTCVIDMEKSLYCWGYNDSGQLTGVDEYSQTPRSASFNSSKLASVDNVSSGGAFTCAASGNQMFCWGANDYLQLGGGYGLAQSSSSPITVVKNVLEIHTVNPSSLNINEGDQQVTILGDGISSRATVTIDGQEYENNSSSAEIISESITVTVPENAIDSVKTVDVKVTNPDGESATLTQSLSFKLITPSINYVYPSEIGVTKGKLETVHIVSHENNFMPGATVFIGSLQASVISNQENYIEATFTMPDTITESGVWDVRVVNPNGAEATSSNAISYDVLTPNITSITPAASYVGASSYITITGTGLARYNWGVGPKLFVGGNEATLTNYTYDPDNGSINGCIFSLSNQSIAGKANVVIENADGFRQTIIDGYEFLPIPDKTIKSVTFSENDQRKEMVINGIGLVGMQNPGEYVEATARSLVTLNASELPFCTEGVGASKEEFVASGVDEKLVSDNPPCYSLISNNEIVITPTKAIIHLPDNFDLTAQGTVSVNGSNTFTFNQQTTNPGGNEEPAEPSVIVNNKPLEGKPTISKRPTFSGVAEPGATVTVTVRSDPIVCTTTADSNGNWSCTLPSDLPPGDHTVTVRIVNPDASVDELGPYAVTVAGGGTVISNTTPLAPNTGLPRASSIAASVAFLLIGSLVSVSAIVVGIAQQFRARKA